MTSFLAQSPEITWIKQFETVNNDKSPWITIDSKSQYIYSAGYKYKKNNDPDGYSFISIQKTDASQITIFDILTSERVRLIQLNVIMKIIIFIFILLVQLYEI